MGWKLALLMIREGKCLARIEVDYFTVLLVCVAQLQDDEASKDRVGRTEHKARRNDATQKRYSRDQQDR